MATKKRATQAEPTASLIKFREKRKWQIALRRYVLEKNICVEYAPYFGLDIENMRKWFEYQFKDGIGWDDFAGKWQFDHCQIWIYAKEKDTGVLYGDAELKD